MAGWGAGQWTPPDVSWLSSLNSRQERTVADPASNRQQLRRVSENSVKRIIHLAKTVQDGNTRTKVGQL